MSTEDLDDLKLDGAEVVQKLESQLAHGGIVDENLVDQVLIFMALATSHVSSSFHGSSCVEHQTCDPNLVRHCKLLVGPLSTHTESAIRIAETMLGYIVFLTRTYEGVGTVLTCETKASAYGLDVRHRGNTCQTAPNSSII